MILLISIQMSVLSHVLQLYTVVFAWTQDTLAWELALKHLVKKKLFTDLPDANENIFNQGRSDINHLFINGLTVRVGISGVYNCIQGQGQKIKKPHTVCVFFAIQKGISMI